MHVDPRSLDVCAFPGDMELTETPLIFFRMFQTGKAVVEIGGGGGKHGILGVSELILLK